MKLGLGEIVILVSFADFLLAYLASAPVWFVSALVCGQLLWLFIYLRNLYNTFERMNVPYSPPLPIFGNIFEYSKEGQHAADMKAMQKYGNVFGTFIGLKPILMVADVELIKTMFIKDFTNFTNRSATSGMAKKESLLSKLLTVTKDDKWRRMRATITPSFTSGKMKHMAPLVQRCVDNLSQLFTETSESSSKEFDVHNFFGCLTLDVISSCAFATDVNSIQNPENELISQSRGLFKRNLVGPMNVLISLIPNVLLKLLPALGLEFGVLKAEHFYRRILSKIMEERRKNPDARSRNDFLQLLLDTQNSSSTKTGTSPAEIQVSDLTASLSSEEQHWRANREALTDEEIMAQSFLFLVAGYHTTATTLTFCMYCLATHPEVQQRCFEELKTTIDEKEISYEMIQSQLPYLESVILETLRLYPPATRFDRECSMDYQIAGIQIPAGISVAVPVYAIHHNAQYYPNPELFLPERFSLEEKSKRDASAFLPFGIGPRNCIGMRFALLEIKQALANILLKFKFLPCQRTVKRAETKTRDKKGAQDGI